MCAGAEADNASITSQAEDECWIKAELYVTSDLSHLRMHQPLGQLQTSSQTQVHETQHERDAPQPSSPPQVSRARVW